MHDAQHGQHGEPEQHDGAKQPADPRGAAALDHEHADQDHDGDRQHVGGKQRRHGLEPFDGAQHRDGGGDHAIAVEHGGAEDAKQDEPAPAAHGDAPQRRGQGSQREDAAFAVVVGAQDKGHVFERDHDEQRPEDEREHAEHVVRRGLDGVVAGEALAQRIERRRADVAVDHAQGSNGQQRKRFAPGLSVGVLLNIWSGGALPGSHTVCTPNAKVPPPGGTDPQEVVVGG